MPAACLALLALLLPAGPGDDVRYQARVDERNRIFVDVENQGREPIAVTAMTVVFYDSQQRTLLRITLDCHADCSVTSGASESFGPIEPPPDWDSVRASEVSYRETPPDERSATPERRTQEPAPVREPPAAKAPERPAESPSPGADSAAPRAPRPPAAVDWSSPEAVLRAFYVAINRGDVARARELRSRSANAATGQAELEAWMRRETKDGTVTDISVLQAASEASPHARLELRFADGSSARRQAVLVREGPGWKIERLEPAR